MCKSENKTKCVSISKLANTKYQMTKMQICQNVI